MINYFSQESIYCAKYVCENQDIWTDLQESIQDLCEGCVKRFQFIYQISSEKIMDQILVIENGSKRSFERSVESIAISREDIEFYKEKFIPTEEFPVQQYYHREFDRSVYEYSISPSSVIFFIYDINLTHTPKSKEAEKEFKVEIKSSNEGDLNEMINLLFC